MSPSKHPSDAADAVWLFLHRGKFESPTPVRNSRKELQKTANVLCASLLCGFAIKNSSAGILLSSSGLLQASR
jgi:hypothetical protein